LPLAKQIGQSRGVRLKMPGRRPKVAVQSPSISVTFRDALHLPNPGNLAVSEKWIVLKFGGTSVAGREQWETIGSIARARRAEGFRVLLVCSAVAGVTNRLGDLARQPDSPRLKDELLAVHKKLASELDVDESQWLQEADSRLRLCLENLVDDSVPRNRAALLALGEWMSTRIGCGFLAQQMDARWIDARDALETLSEKDLSPARQWLSAACSAAVAPDLVASWSQLSPVLVTQGFVARTPEGETALLGRGGSDTSAALLAGRLAASRLEIWTDVPGLFSADPRLISEARLLREVGYAEALEMAASGAKVVHPRSIRAAAATRTPVVIRDLNRRAVAGTRIGLQGSPQPGIKTVTCQEGMAVILLQNLDARFPVGFLADVFDTFRKRGISVDLVATSETTTTVAINCESNHLGDDDLDGLAEVLATHSKVRMFKDCICVNLVGRGARTALSRLHPVMEFFDDHPLLMASQSANDL